MRCPSGSSSRPTASPACGRTRRSSAGCSSRATSRRGSPRPRRWATTASRNRPRGGSAPRRSRTGRRRSARAGSSAASTAATPPRATPSREISDRGPEPAVRGGWRRGPGRLACWARTDRGTARDCGRNQPRGEPMPPERLSALDASFLAVEGPSAHMHVGWAATFAPPADGPRPDFETLFEHISGRLGRAPRFRQRLASDPLGLSAPLLIDAEDFDPADHIHRSAAEDISQLADAVLSEPLPRDRPLWEFWIADGLADRRIGLVGKAHHCMVDGLAAVELGSLLLDLGPDAEPPADEDRDWLPAPPPHALELLARGAWDRTREQLALLRYPLAVARSPLTLPALGLRTARALAGAVLPVAPASHLNEPGSPDRHLATARRPLDELRAIRSAHEVTINDVLLAAVAGALRRHAERAEELPRDLKAMVPVNVRGDDGGVLGNRITFMFVELPASVPDPLVRLKLIGDATRARKEAGVPEDADLALKALSYAPRPVQKAAAHALARPRV